MDMGLGTTTWRKRNKELMERTVNTAKEVGIYRPSIIEYGPGGAVDFLLGCLPEGYKSDWSAMDKIQRGVVRLLESGLRKTGFFHLETSEPEEIAYLFEHLAPSGIHVVDKERMVIDAVRKMIAMNGLSVPVTCQILDIDDCQPEQESDIVIAYNIIERTKNPQISSYHIAKTARVGGLLSTTYPTFSVGGFERIDDNLYQRKI
jgi:hypothetical protein